MKLKMSEDLKKWKLAVSRESTPTASEEAERARASWTLLRKTVTNQLSLLGNYVPTAAPSDFNSKTDSWTLSFEFEGHYPIEMRLSRLKQSGRWDLRTYEPMPVDIEMSWGLLYSVFKVKLSDTKSLYTLGLSTALRLAEIPASEVQEVELPF